MKSNVFLLIIIAFFSNSLYAQSVEKNSDKYDSMAFDSEKLYIHSDKDAYLPGDTIWFRGYLINSSYLSKVPLSNYIYVELYSDTLISRVKIKCSDKGYAGYLPIKKDVSPGNYVIQGYTKNMQNFPAEFAFQKKVVVLKKNKFAVPTRDEIIKAAGYDIDVQFLPESGRYLINRPARIAFKAVGSDGKSANVKIMLYTNADIFVGEYESRHNGMGLINLINTDADGYYAIVSGAEGFTQKKTLPKPVRSGAVIEITRIGDKIGVSVCVTSDLKRASFIVRNGSEELIKKPITSSLQSGDFKENFIMSEESLPYGVNSAQIINDTGEILAERLFFINNNSRPKIDVLQNKHKYEKREKVELTFSLKEVTGKSVAGEFSLAVTDSTLAPVFCKKDNILSYMELSSELRGEIEDPGYYFNNPTAESEKYLDIVMMTHGWRYHTPASGMFKREYGQEISGSISGMFKREPKNTTLMILAPAIQLQQAYTLPKTNTFTLEGLDFPDSTKFLLGVAGESGGQLFGLTIKEDIFLPISHLKTTIYSPKERETIQKASDLLGVILPADEERKLKPIVIEAHKEVFRPKYNPSPFLQSFSKSQLKEREDLKEYDDSFLLDYLVRTFPGLKVGTGNSGRILQTTRGVRTIMGEFYYPQPLVYIDGMNLTDGQSILDQFLVMDVENVAFLRGNAGSMFQTLNGVVLITTKRGRGLAKKAPTNIAKIAPLGYQKNVEFYSPKYETTAEKESKRDDVRSTIYWNPCIRTDENGSASVVFYTGDHNSKLNISAEGVTMSGEFVAL